MLGTVLYAYVGRLVDFSSRGTFILTNRLKAESIDLQIRVNNMNLFKNLENGAEETAKYAVLEKEDIELGDVIGT